MTTYKGTIKFELTLDDSTPVDPVPVDPAPQPVPPLPFLAKYLENAATYGKKHSEYLARTSEPFDPQLDATYYDGIKVYYNLNDMMPNTWATNGVVNCLRIYRDNYVLKNDGKVPSHYRFTAGLRKHWDMLKDSKSKAAIQLMAHNSAFADDFIPVANTEGWEFSRDTAFLIECYLDYRAVAGVERPKLFPYIEQAIRHLDQVKNGSPKHVEPFMVALTCRALIQAYTEYFNSGGQGSKAAIQAAIDWVWENTWNASAKAFAYSWARLDTDLAGDGRNPAPDMNLLIAPVFGWLYKETKAVKYRERGDLIFAGGVEKAYMERGKHFNQNYCWSNKYLEWRK